MNLKKMTSLFTIKFFEKEEKRMFFIDRLQTYIVESLVI